MGVIMAEVKTERRFILVLTKDELLLVSKGLRGTLDDAVDIESASALQVSIMRARHVVLQQELFESQKLMDNMARSGHVPLEER